MQRLWEEPKVISASGAVANRPGGGHAIALHSPNMAMTKLPGRQLDAAIAGAINAVHYAEIGKVWTMTVPRRMFAGICGNERRHELSGAGKMIVSGTGEQWASRSAHRSRITVHFLE
jgi:hypothetical protein